MPMIRFASTNAIKLEEARALLGEIEPIALDLPEIQSVDPSVVVRHKLAGIAGLGLDGPVLVEDTALVVDAWDGLPGALVKWFVETWGPAGLARRTLADGGAGGALAVSAVGVLDRGRTGLWTGALRGRIVAPRGELGGWTSIFEVDGCDRTLAELALDERLAVTMRRAPLLEARAWLLDRARSA